MENNNNTPQQYTLPGFDDYAGHASKTSAPVTDYLVLQPNLVHILHGVLGASGEVGELADQLKRHLFYGRELDLVNLKEEVGDVLWYLQEICRGGGFTMQDAAEANIRKLAVRYAEKFAAEQALNRDLDAERKALEG